MRWFVTDPATGDVTLGQAPNVSISVFWIATAGHRLAPAAGPWATGLTAVRWGALTWWATDELVRGASPARHTAGAVTLAWLGVRAAGGWRADGPSRRRQVLPGCDPPDTALQSRGD